VGWRDLAAVVFAGRARADQGIDVLLRAWQLLLESGRDPADRYAIIGDGRCARIWSA